ncbi:leucine-rich_repeat domain-containing protein [Hexamita inflata]|uniref:Leucine-rich_repeat domain-containing protein n=1 Tax=Hexamita inflata TaxID=28002 RepID=A0ABP1HA19_9EUKA
MTELKQEINTASDLRKFLSCNGDTSTIQLNIPQNEIINVSSTNIDKIDILKQLKGNTVIHAGYNRISDLKPIRKQIQLEILNIYDNNVKDISCLAELKQLEIFNAQNNKIKSIDVFHDFFNLKALYLTNNRLKSISALKNNTQLQKLHLNNNKQIVDINIVPIFSQLTELRIGGVCNIKSLDFIKNLFDLMILDVSSNNLTDISAISKCVKLSILNISQNNVSDISIISFFCDLKTFNASNNRIYDVSSLKDLKKLLYLYLGNNQIYDISSLISVCAGLNELMIGSNRITELPKFTSRYRTGTMDLIDLSFNYIDDMQYLEVFDPSYLNISNNYVRDTECVEIFRSLIELNISNNMIDCAEEFEPISVFLREFTHSPQRESSYELTKIRYNIRKMNALSSVQTKYSQKCKTSLNLKNGRSKIILRLGTELKKLSQIVEMFITAFGE